MKSRIVTDAPGGRHKSGKTAVIEQSGIYLPDGRRALTVLPETQLGLGIFFDKMTVEAPVFIGQCQIECSRIGAFSQINWDETYSPSGWCRIECESIGRYCSIARNVNIGFASHAASFLSTSTLFKFNRHAREVFYPFLDERNEYWEQEMARLNTCAWRKPLAIIGNDVWIGFGSTVMNGVRIGDGAIVAAGSVVTKDIEPFTLVGGAPARAIKKRFPDNLCERLVKLQWWNYNPSIVWGLDISNPRSCIDELEERVENAEKYVPPTITVDITKQKQ